MKMAIPFTSEQLSAMRASYEAGCSIQSLSAEYGLSSTAIRDRLLSLGVIMRRKGAPSGLRDPGAAARILALRDAGLTVAVICGKLGISERTYYRRLQAQAIAP